MSDDLFEREEWRVVAGYEGLYEVSNMGRVRSYHAHHKRAVPYLIRGGTKASKTPGGYHTVTLWKDKKRTVPTIATLVMRAFAGPRPVGMEVAHLNGNAHDDRLHNLSYVTHRENVSHMRRHGTAPIGEKNGRAIVTREKVKQMRLMRDAGSTGRELATAFGLDVRTVYAITTRRIWKHVA